MIQIASRPTAAPALVRRPLQSDAPAIQGAPTSAPADAVTIGSAPPATPNPHSAQQTASDAAASAVPGAAGFTLKVLTYNTMMDMKTGLDKAANLIRQTGADLVGLQESVLKTRALAKKLGMNWVQQDVRTALLSKFPISKISSERYAVAVDLPTGQKLGFANAHLTSFPYQAHQICHLAAGGGPFLDTEEEAIASADKTRGDEVRTMIKESNALQLPMIATGDFNEPSRLDWTQTAADIKRNPVKVDWPASRQFAEAGFTDSYRQQFPDEIARPGYTWTPTTAIDDPKDHHDRIDFVHFRGPELTLKNIQIVGENNQNADIVVQPYPSDHRGMLATFEVAPAAPKAS